MRWEVTGADRETGKDVRGIVNAWSESGAVKKARARGVLASSVRRVPKHSAPPSPANALADLEERFQTDGEASAIWYLRWFATLFYVIGFLSLPGGCNPTRLDKRFHEDSAYGAKANAAEAIFGESDGWRRFLGSVTCVVLAALWSLGANVIRSRATTRAVLDALSRQAAAADKAPAPRDGDPGLADPAELREQPRARPPS